VPRLGRPNTACNPTDPRTSPVTLAVLPDEGEKPYVDLLQTAQASIRVFGYQMGYGGILDTLTAKARAGILVRVILDGNTQRTVNEKYRVALVSAGAQFEWSEPQFSYMHAKTLIVDEKAAIVSTGNYSLSFIEKERNYTATISDSQDVGDLVALFEADWSQTSPDLSCTRLLVSPVNSEGRLVDLVKSATSTLYVESMQFDDRAVHDAVLERKAAGVDVRVLVAAPSWVDANSSAGADLVAHGVPAKYLASPAIHVKSMIVDGARAYLGSENISWTSLTKNREIGVVVTDAPAVTTMGATFQTDWAAATSF
jgi:phosphatidylserine/phosphatidylglycerophosphate/cardiolipin synthase-like enzyme